MQILAPVGMVYSVTLAGSSTSSLAPKNAQAAFTASSDFNTVTFNAAPFLGNRAKSGTLTLLAVGALTGGLYPWAAFRNTYGGVFVMTRNVDQFLRTYKSDAIQTLSALGVQINSRKEFCK